jgi:pSer/pThr/pTyr-binding forkhead associated (FHA) protein
MSHEIQGELLPLGGGDNIPLIRERLTLGRRESCDICTQFPNISGLHCELTFRNGYWYIRDLNSTNGVKVNGQRVSAKLLHPGDEVAIGKRRYMIQYNLPADQHALDEETTEDIFSQSLLERAGLEKPKHDRETADYLVDDE